LIFLQKLLSYPVYLFLNFAIMCADQTNLEKQKTELLAQQSLLMAQLATLKMILGFNEFCSNFECTGDCNLVHFVPDETVENAVRKNDVFFGRPYEADEDDGIFGRPYEVGEIFNICDDENCECCLG